MSEGFDVGRDAPAVRVAQRAYIDALLAEMLPALRLAARGSGYALTVHGSLARDIDLVAVAWTIAADDPEHLVDRLCGVIAGATGRCLVMKKGDKRYGEKPHGRRAYTLIHGGHTAEIDLSVVPPSDKAEQ